MRFQIFQISVFSAMVTFLAAALRAQLPDANALVREAEDLSRFASVQIVTRQTSEVSRHGGGKPTASTTVSRRLSARPDRSRQEITTDGSTFLTVSDGANTLLYMTPQNRYSTVPGASGALALDSDKAR
jgi:hypothetical protein